jgi:hypothetical protein
MRISVIKYVCMRRPRLSWSPRGCSHYLYCGETRSTYVLPTATFEPAFLRKTGLDVGLIDLAR